ncbi:hypothetical protein OG2516_12704 [Oceanicola granulosus HTCC2516]|uniref:Uncharacterized protein n=1 Tax=Oceanicola granulosus (strain ATCC BAA-861 / DSM 15982 / KCTC 12143 / HTCC2516) TaxID=314256 RepID=Q2CC40_OCEGH|nr:hypothetical protein [Oceanicola granulosus]EAR50241.1 hypothetical protein OG2516_12704 [Oceanicola granulosus HTCC2516]
MSGVRLAVYDLPEGPLVLPESGTAWFACGRGHAAAGEVTGRVEGPGWLFEAAPADAPAPDAVAVLSEVVAPEGRRLVRFDKVEAASGSATPPHRHQGPGLRRLAAGAVIAEVGAHRERIEPGGAWFESGTETVVGRNVGDAATLFYRLLLLPEALAGGASSFLAVAEAPAAKRNATVTLLGEARL